MSTLTDVLAVPAFVEQSRVYRAIQSLFDALHRGAETTRLKTIGRSLSHYTRDSWLYRWLTKEPEPDVIVIDLRDTWTVAPFIAILDWLIELLAVAYQDSRLEHVIAAVHRRLFRSPVRFLSVLLLAVLLPILLYTAVQTGVSTTTVVLLVVTVGSGVGALVDLSWPELRETRPVQLAIAALEPPEPPERDS